MNLTHTSHVGWQPINTMLLLGIACSVLMLTAATLLMLPWVEAEHPERMALFLAVCAAVQMGYMLTKPTLPWVLVTGWALLQWHVLFMAFERSTGLAMWLILLALVVQSGISMYLGVQSCGKLLTLRRFEGN